MFVDFGSDLAPTKVISSYRLLKSPVRVVTRQPGRRCWGIALKNEGRTIYNQGGKQILSDKNHVVLLPKGSRYTWTCVEPGECMIIDFDAPETGSAITCVEVSDSSYILSAFARIEKCKNPEHPTSRLDAMQQLYGILLFLAKAANKKYTPKDQQQRISPAVDHMLENYSDPQITNRSLAELCGISEVYFRKSFEAVYDCPPIRYLHRLRIRKAKAILLGDYDTIGQVAESVGYSSVYHFSKMFKIYTGISPTQYARSGDIA